MNEEYKNTAAYQFYRDVLAIVAELARRDVRPNTPEGRVLLALVDALEKYEKGEFPINAPEPAPVVSPRGTLHLPGKANAA